MAGRRNAVRAGNKACGNVIGKAAVTAVGTAAGRAVRLTGRVIAFVLALALTLMFQPPAEAEARYTYTVRFFSGQQGTVGGGEMIVFENLNYGDRINFSLRDVKLHDNSKYYVKGIRQSGRDNNTAETTSFLVTEDRDYVVAYGLLKDAVAYNVNYRDVEGNELAPSETYYGNIGDRPVVAYLYIAGYQPQAYNLVGTLSENVAENEFTFVYTPVPEGGVTIIPGTVTDLGLQTVVVGGTGLPPGGGAAGGETPPEEENLPDAPVPQEQGEEGTAPNETEDINDPGVPLAGPGEGPNAALLKIPRAVRIAMVSTFALLLIYGIWRYRYVRKKEKKNEV